MKDTEKADVNKGDMGGYIEKIFPTKRIAEPISSLLYSFGDLGVDFLKNEGLELGIRIDGGLYDRRY